MTEHDWLYGTDPARMHAWLSRTRQHGEPRHWPSKRKQRLFGVACCRACNDVRRELADDYEREGPIIPDDHWFRAWCANHIASLNGGTRCDLLRHILGNPFREPLLAKVACCPICMGEGGWVANDGEVAECRRCTGGLRKTRENLSNTSISLAQEVYYHGQDGCETGPLYDSLIECGCDQLAEHFNPATQECPQCGGAGEYEDVAHEDLDGYGGIAVTVRCERCVGGRVPMVQEYNDGGVSYWFNLLEPNRRHLTPERAMPAHPRGCWALDLILGKR